MRILAIMLALIVVLGRPSTPSMPRIKTASPGAEEIWSMTLPEAIRVGLDNSEPVRCIWIGAQQIPLGGFEPDAATPGDLEPARP